MEKFNLKDDINTLGFEVKTFPLGIGEAFDTLAKMLPMAASVRTMVLAT